MICYLSYISSDVLNTANSIVVKILKAYKDEWTIVLDHKFTVLEGRMLCVQLKYFVVTNFNEAITNIPWEH